jgi:hypothetical protein
MRRCLLILALAAAPLLAQELKPIALPKPQTTGGKPLMQLLSERKTTREFAPGRLTPQQISNVLWAGFGINREKGPRGGTGRTAPSAMNWQEVELYVVLEEGVFIYDATGNRLTPVLAGDVRAQTGPGGAAVAAMSIVYVSDYAKMGMYNNQPDQQAIFTNTDIGFIAQNVYLAAANEGLGCWFRTVRGDGLRKTLKLAAEQKIMYAQSVGKAK